MSAYQDFVDIILKDPNVRQSLNKAYDRAHKELHETNIQEQLRAGQLEKQLTSARSQLEEAQKRISELEEAAAAQKELEETREQDAANMQQELTEVRAELGELKAAKGYTVNRQLNFFRTLFDRIFASEAFSNKVLGLAIQGNEVQRHNCYRAVRRFLTPEQREAFKAEWYRPKAEERFHYEYDRLLRGGLLELDPPVCSLFNGAKVVLKCKDVDNFVGGDADLPAEPRADPGAEVPCPETPEAEWELPFEEADDEAANQVEEENAEEVLGEEEGGDNGVPADEKGGDEDEEDEENDDEEKDV